MKTFKLTLSAIVMLMLLHSQLYSQVPNASFENWENNNAGLHPEEWQTFDAFVHFATEERGIIRSEDSQTGSYAMRMEPSDFGDGLEGHVAFLGSMPGGSGDKIPLTEKPGSVTINYKSELNPDEESVIMFFFYDSDDNIIVAEEVLLQPTNGSYESPTFDFDNLNQPVMPDVAGYYIIVNSHDSDDNVGTEDYLTLDEISFNGVNHEIPNGNFEDWWEVTFDEPENWYTSNYISAFFNNRSVSASSDAYSGSQALEITPFVIFEELPDMIDDEMFTFAITGDFEPFIDDHPSPGFKVSDEEEPVVSGFYKYEPGHESDSASVGLILYDEGEVVQEDYITLDPATDYTLFTLESGVADDVSFDEASVGVILTSTESTEGVLTVDNLQWNEGQPNSIDLMSKFKNGKVHSYPNPARDTWNIELPDTHKGGTVYIHDIRGNLVKKVVLDKDAGREIVDLSQIEQGTYLYSIEIGESVYKGRFIKK